MDINQDEGTILKLANAAILVFVSRISAPLLLGVCGYIALSVMNLKTDVASLTSGMNATVLGIQKDIDDLKQWRNAIDGGRENHGRNI